MSYPKQASVNAKLHDQTLNALEDIGSKGLRMLAALWKEHRKEMQLAIMNSYQAASPNGTWNLQTFKTRAQPLLKSEFRSILERFRALSHQSIKSNLNALYAHSWKRYAWMLDQLTPASRNVRIPHKTKLHEAAITNLYYGAQASTAWADKWSAWVDSYGSALMHNLALGSASGSSVSDAVSEVDATKSNTPQSTLINALTRLYDFAATEAMTAGEETIADMNDDLTEVEIWKTRGDLRVCDQCSDNEGLPIDEADGTIPAHPNCHCYPMLVPKSYAELLQSGDADDRDLALDMDRKGIAPNALVIRNEDGDIAAKAIVSFNQWIKGQGMGVTAQ